MNQNTLIIGAGKSGIAAAELLLSHNINICIYDKNLCEKQNISLKERGVVCLKDLDMALMQLENTQLVVTSPGIPKNHILHRTAKDKNIKIISELELAYLHCQTPIIAVTGSNGKSSAVKLLTETINASGKKAVACGNYGTPLSYFLTQTNQPDYYVAEVSSFQLEWCHEFKPLIGIILNIQADHLDRHESMKQYAAEKYKMFKNMSESDLAIVFRDVLNTFGPIPGNARVSIFSSKPKTPSEFSYSNHMIVHGNNACVKLNNSYFDNTVTGLTAAACYMAAEFLNIDNAIIQKSVCNFQALSHRTEKCHEINGRIFIDDSKATNLASMEAAIKMFGNNKKINLIAGGILKEKNLLYLKDLLEKSVKKIYLIGKDREIMYNAWNDVVPCENSVHLEEAVKRAFKHSEAGDIILLSPACASFDQFSGYKERGEVFKQIAKHLK